MAALLGKWKWLLGGSAAAALAIAMHRRASGPAAGGSDGATRSQGTDDAAAKGADGKREESRRGRVGLNADFLDRLKEILKICFPSITSKPARLLGLHSTALVLRTLVSIYVAKLDGQIVRALVDRDGKTFVRRLGWWCMIGVGASFINAQIKFLESKLAISFRTLLTEYALERYMKDDTYYRVCNLDSRLTNADQLLTEDVHQFCKLLAHLWSHLSKPILDVLLISVQMGATARSKGSGLVGPSLVAALAVGASTKLLQWASPPFGKLVKQQAELDGRYRFVHSRLITNAEEVAFYGGHAVEHGILKEAYYKLVKHMNSIFGKRVGYNVLEGFLLKYLWSTAGYAMVAWPAFFSEAGNTQSASDRTQDYVVSRGLLMNAADAIERIMSSYKEITELAGYTARVSGMVSVFDDVRQGKFRRPELERDPAKAALLRGRGTQTVSSDDSIRFNGVPIVSPTGDVLVESLSFEMRPTTAEREGTHILISGPNGCGKTSLFRVCASLWPAYRGDLEKPGRGALFYIPQKPYLSLGNLRDQIIYPHTHQDMIKAGYTDDDLMQIMRTVHLTKIVGREGGWEAHKSWMDVLSGGEKQRVGMARLFYHKPKYAILDECTSQVSIDVEGKMYQAAKDAGITLLTVTHRPSLRKFHDYLLQFDGEGGWQFTELDSAAVETFAKEKERLEAQLAEVPRIQARLEELTSLTGASPMHVPMHTSI